MLSGAIQEQILERYADVRNSQASLRERIQDFEEKPLVSLEAAIVPLINVIQDIEDMVAIVRADCQTSIGSLSSDEAASIKLYTLEWPIQPSFYNSLNEILRSGTREAIEPWFLYLRLFTVALSKLPSNVGQTVYRGVKLDISGEYMEDKTDVCWPFSSCSLSLNVIEKFLGQSGPRTLFIIECDSGKRIKQYSMYTAEDEVLLTVGTYFKVVSNSDQKNGLHIIKLKEIQPPASLSFQQQILMNLLGKCLMCSQVDLSEHQLQDEDIEFVVNEAITHKRCTELHLQRNIIKPKGVSTIALALKSNTTLQKLWLDNNCVSDIGVGALAKILSCNHSSLTMLGLNANAITDEGAKCLANMLKTNTKLIFLRLSNNAISDQGVQLLADALSRHNKTLESIDISSNKFVTDRSINCIARMLKTNESLSSLNISHCSLSENAKQNFRVLTQSNDGFVLFI
ncbi:unnamed protein product [Rotaria socialis]|uniref:NAD(P)(+)--arginine ADP-ribosyltransferase n=1 Tax=Rotaria socialis TaxID=392032 RepID=A0A821DF70_9BILA|nr:unnamed protein product [Rotaria socialis]CAF4619574.1 unnamed protein product [Rotaria socialis]